jgi:DNA invertase Pin-like site-specific DNA recombinase
MTVYAYYRVSTGKQDYNSQKLGVVEYCNKNGLTINKEVLDDGVSGCVKAKDRNLWKIIKGAKTGDHVIVAELSRLGRSTVDVLETCNTLSKKGVNVYFVKQAMGLDQSPMGKMMTAILSAFAEMERDLIRQRTIEGLAKAKMSGKHLGRPYGFTFRRLEKNAEIIQEKLKNGETKMAIAKELNVSWTTLHRFIKENNYTRNYTPAENRSPIFSERKKELLEYLKSARRISQVCKEFNITNITLHKFLEENKIKFIKYIGFRKKEKERVTFEEIEETEDEIATIKREDAERTKNYLTMEDFNKMYGAA